MGQTRPFMTHCRNEGLQSGLRIQKSQSLTLCMQNKDKLLLIKTKSLAQTQGAPHEKVLGDPEVTGLLSCLRQIRLHLCNSRAGVAFEDSLSLEVFLWCGVYFNHHHIDDEHPDEQMNDLQQT